MKIMDEKGAVLIEVSDKPIVVKVDHRNVIVNDTVYVNRKLTIQKTVEGDQIVMLPRGRQNEIIV